MLRLLVKLVRREIKISHIVEISLKKFNIGQSMRNIKHMESYSERLERECDETDKMFPVVKKIVDKILLINRVSNLEFDYMIERKHLMYEAVKKNLNLVSDLDIEKWAASKVNGIDPGEYGYGDMLIMGAKAMRDGEIKSIEDK